MECINCQKELGGRSQKKFCSTSCAAIYNNKLYPKRAREKSKWPTCATCENTVKRKSGKFCPQCIAAKKHFKDPT